MKLENLLKGILIGTTLLLTSCATYNSSNYNPRYPYLLRNLESKPIEEKKESGSGWKFVPLLPINVGAKIIRGERISALDFIHDLAIVGGGYSIYRNNNKKEDKKSSGGGSNPPYPPDSGGGDDGDKDDGW